jgi:hypothetical protein
MPRFIARLQGMRLLDPTPRRRRFFGRFLPLSPSGKRPTLQQDLATERGTLPMLAAELSVEKKFLASLPVRGLS